MTTITHSQNISSDFKLINFNVPKYLIKNFDTLVRFKRVSRTSMLVHLMENYLRSEQQKLKEDKHLNDLVTHLHQQNKSEIINEMREHYEPPMIPNVSDERSWNDHIEDLSKDDWSDISGVDRLFKL
jgi:metal-responsive CopG/Arc/MetJ family transcriptional regulator